MKAGHTPKQAVVDHIRHWREEAVRWRASKRPPIMVEVILQGLVLTFFLALAWGHPEGRAVSGTNAGNFFLQGAYFLGFYVLLFSYSRTISLRELIRWFCVGLTVIAAASLLTEKWAMSWWHGYSPLFGSWSDKHSAYHFSIVGPIVEEFLKAAPLLLFLWLAKRRHRLHAYAMSDWLLVGYAIGAGFELTEHIFRISDALAPERYSWPQHASALLIPMARIEGDFRLFGQPWSYLGGTHGTSTALVAVAIGLALFLRHRGRGRWVFGIPVASLVWACVDHGLFNLSLDSYSQLRELGFTKFLFALGLGGRVFTFGLGFGVFALAVYEARLLHSHFRREHLRWFADHLTALGVIVSTITTSIWPRSWRVMLRGPKWFLLISIPLVTLVWAVFLLNQLLEYVNVHVSFARQRHVAWWLAQPGSARAVPAKRAPEPAVAGARG